MFNLIPLSLGAVLAAAQAVCHCPLDQNTINSFQVAMNGCFDAHSRLRDAMASDEDVYRNDAVSAFFAALDSASILSDVSKTLECVPSEAMGIISVNFKELLDDIHRRLLSLEPPRKSDPRGMTFHILLSRLFDTYSESIASVDDSLARSAGCFDCGTVDELNHAIVAINSRVARRNMRNMLPAMNLILFEVCFPTNPESSATLSLPTTSLSETRELNLLSEIPTWIPSANSEESDKRNVHYVNRAHLRYNQVPGPPTTTAAVTVHFTEDLDPTGGAGVIPGMDHLTAVSGEPDGPTEIIFHGPKTTGAIEEHRSKLPSELVEEANSRLHVETVPNPSSTTRHSASDMTNFLTVSSQHSSSKSKSLLSSASTVKSSSTISSGLPDPKTNVGIFGTRTRPYAKHAAASAMYQYLPNDQKHHRFEVNTSHPTATSTQSTHWSTNQADSAKHHSVLAATLTLLVFGLITLI